MEKKNNNILGFSALSGSLMLYALSGVLVVGLNDYFTKVGQVSIRAASSFVLMLLVFVSIGLYNYFRKKKSLELKLIGKYNKVWLFLEFVLRPFGQIAFAYATLSLIHEGSSVLFGPTSAIFYLFSSKVIFGALIKLVLGDKKGERKFEWYDIVSYVMVLFGMYLYQTNKVDFVSGISLGVILSLLAGFIEAVKTKTMNMLSVEKEDRILISLYEFSAGAIIAMVIVFAFGLDFVQATFSYSGLFIALLFAAIVGVGTLLLELVGFANFDADLGNIVLAAELAIAPLLNIQVKKMFPGFFGDISVDLVRDQWIGIFLLAGSLVLVALIPFFKKLKARKLEKDKKNEK